ncbi:KilA-N domain-containing protein [Megavirus baoshan]|uniref:KilA-N domain-containing protein n=1 Tax=Megavirus baoshan TaxID=2496520 RepID=A0A8K1T2U1_9VIRU|nr:KilA-N domain-containing protein [Megavirus baoshan]UFX99904.1 KilA-N domain-containing protein [Megavirus baoshan]
MDKNHMNNVVFQDINEQYAYGQYSEFVVIIDKYTGYVNMTKLCTRRKRFLSLVRNRQT